MTGEIIGFGGRKPPPDPARQLADALDCFPQHDPFRPVVELLDSVPGRTETAINAAVKDLTGLVREARDTIRPGLSVSEAEGRAIVEHLAHEAVSSAARHAGDFVMTEDRKARIGDAVLLLIAAIVGYAACYLRTPVREVATTIDAQIKIYEPSDTEGLAAACRSMIFVTDAGRRYCRQGSVWLSDNTKPEPAKAKPDGPKPEPAKPKSSR